MSASLRTLAPFCSPMLIVVTLFASPHSPLTLTLTSTLALTLALALALTQVGARLVFDGRALLRL